MGLIILCLISFYYFKSSPNKLYRKARRFHKKGEKYYVLGDSELAKEYYEESNQLREKAKELSENGMV